MSINLNEHDLRSTYEQTRAGEQLARHLAHVASQIVELREAIERHAQDMQRADAQPAINEGRNVAKGGRNE
jgi:hypothetical protein